MRIITGYGAEASIAGMHASIPRNKRMVQERGREPFDFSVERVNEGGVEGCGQEGAACKGVLRVYMTVHPGVSLQKASNSSRKGVGGVGDREASVKVLAAG